MKDLSGQTLGQYTIESPIGQGGMASVYKAYQARMRRYVAVKILPEALAADPSFIARFEREAHTIAQLEHPAVLPVYDYGEEGNITYIVMRYVDTGTLAGRLQKRPLSNAEIQRLTRQIAGGLEYAHRQGVIHRDLKPDNIFLDAEGNALLGDFGIARIAEGTQELTGNAVIGTPAYMSPEQGMGQKLDGRSDIYALGIILFELFTGRVPFKAETPMGLVVKHITETMPDPREIKADIPAGVAAVILKATAKDPQDRYNSPLELAAALEGALGVATAPASRLTPATVLLGEEEQPGPASTTGQPASFPPTVLEGEMSGGPAGTAVPAVQPRPAAPAPAEKPATGRKFPVWLPIAGLIAFCVVCGGLLTLAALINGSDNNNNNNNSIAQETATAPRLDGNDNSNSNGTDPSIISSLPTSDLGNTNSSDVPTIEVPTPAFTGPSGSQAQAVPPDFIGMQVVQSAFLGSSGRDSYEFANILEGGMSGAVQPVGNNLDLVVEIIDGEGNLFLTVDQVAGGGTEVFNFTPPTLAGSYFVVVSDFNGQSGEYVIALAGTPAIFFVVDSGKSIAGRVDETNTSSFFIQGIAGRTVTIQVTPDSSLDAIIKMFQDTDIVTALDTGVIPDPLAQADEFFPGGAETLTFTFPRDGAFIIDVGGFPGAVGTFTMTISP